MRIGIDCRLPYYQMGGISRYVLNLLPALAALDQAHHYQIFHSRRDSRDYTPAEPNFSRGVLMTPAHHRLERWALATELLPRRLDVWHSPDFIPPQAGAGRRIITVHDLNFLYYPEYLTEESRRYYAGQIEWAVRTANHIAADSEHTRQDLIRQLGVPEGKITTIPLAASSVFTEPVGEHTIQTVLAQRGLSPGFLLFVGTLEPRKNIPALLQAYSRLQRVAAPLVLVGGRGWLYDEIFAAIEALRLGDRVVHLEGVRDRELATLYHAAGVLVLPSHYEGFGFPPLEAMHCGCPVISSNRASLPELVGNAGILLDPDDVPAWSDAIERVLKDHDLRAKLVAAGYQQAERFTWEATARATRTLYLQQE